MPKLRHALICEKVEFHESGNAHSLINCFGAITVKKFPANIKFALVAFWEGEPGESFDRSTTVIDSNGNIIAERSFGEFIFTNPEATDISAFDPIQFPRPGVYAINVNVNGICVENVNISINLKS